MKYFKKTSFNTSDYIGTSQVYNRKHWANVFELIILNYCFLYLQYKTHTYIKIWFSFKKYSPVMDFLLIFFFTRFPDKVGYYFYNWLFLYWIILLKHILIFLLYKYFIHLIWIITVTKTICLWISSPLSNHNELRACLLITYIFSYFILIILHWAILSVGDSLWLIENCSLILLLVKELLKYQ